MSARWEYQTFENNAILTIYDYQGEIENLVLPKFYEGLPITELNYYSKTGNLIAAAIRTIKIPNTYTGITSDGAWTTVEKVYFEGIGGLLKLNANTPWLGTGDKDVFLSFSPQNEEELLDIVLPNDVYSIQEKQFYEYKNIRSIRGEFVEEIGNYSFSSCDALEYIYLPRLSIWEERNYAFTYNENLKLVELCNKNTVLDTNRLDHIVIDNFSGVSGNTKIVLPRSTQNIIGYNAITSTNTPMFRFLTGLSDALSLQISLENGTSAVETVAYGGDAQNAQLGEWYFASDDISIIIKGETIVPIATLSFTVPMYSIDEPLSAKYSSISKYQTNKYYRVGTFDFMIRGSIESTDNQPIKGAIMHLRSMEIKYFDDYIHLDHDDLVVIDGHLFSVEDITYDIKRSPKPYTVYFARLNNIL